MLKYILLFFLFISIFSCELKDQPFVPEKTYNDITLVPMDTIKGNPIFEFNTFSTSPYSTSECLCNFSITKNVYQNHQYIFSCSLAQGSSSYMQFKGGWIEFELNSFTEKPDSLVINSINDSLCINILAVKDSVIQDLTYYQGELQIYKNGKKDVFKSNIYGSCDTQNVKDSI